MLTTFIKYVIFHWSYLFFSLQSLYNKNNSWQDIWVQLFSWTLKTNWLPLPSMSGTSLVSDSNKSTISPCILSSILYHVFQQNLYCPSYQILITHRTPSFILHYVFHYHTITNKIYFIYPSFDCRYPHQF
jgi:hypothetical protein